MRGSKPPQRLFKKRRESHRVSRPLPGAREQRSTGIGVIWRQECARCSKTGRIWAASVPAAQRAIFAGGLLRNEHRCACVLCSKCALFCWPTPEIAKGAAKAWNGERDRLASAARGAAPAANSVCSCCLASVMSVALSRDRCDSSDHFVGNIWQE